MFQRLILTVMLCTAACFGAEETVSFEKDIVYCKAGGVELKLDLAWPSGEGPYPCVVFIHGGGWMGGSRTAYHAVIHNFAKAGYVAATVQYRFAPKFKFPAQVEDVKCAVRYLRAHAKELHIDSEKFGAIGESAGGHLSLMLGLMNKEDGCEGDGGCAEQSSKVQCVVNYYGPGDFLAEAPRSQSGDFIVMSFLGTLDKASPIVKKASPASYIDKSDGPVLTFHGDKDELVPVELAKSLHEALKKANVDEKLEVLEGKKHGRWGAEESDRTMKEALSFFDKHLKKK